MSDHPDADDLEARAMRELEELGKRLSDKGKRERQEKQALHVEHPARGQDRG